MIISLLDESASVRWRRLVINGDGPQLLDSCNALDRAGIPHVVGFHHPYRTPTDKPVAACEGEPWLMVPFPQYSAACSVLFSSTQTSIGVRASGAGIETSLGTLRALRP
jgi:hypothetical protein